MPQCKALDNHMCISLEGSWAPCCRFAHYKRVDINQTSFEEYRNSDYYKQIKKDMETGWADGCSRCKDQELREGKSYRLFFNQNFETDDKVEYIELSLSNKCNLTCRMCGPVWSTSWGKLLKEDEKIKKWNVWQEPKFVKIENIFSQIDISHLKRIKYLGGEPFITPEIKQLFEYLDKHNIIQNIIFECNTNCTLFPDKWIHYLKKFKSVEMSLSIDGIDVVNDYIRYGKTWDIVEKNIIKWAELNSATKNINVEIFTTVQAYNLHNITELKNYAKKLKIKFSTSLMHQPEYLTINALPINYIREIANYDNLDFIKTYNFNKTSFGKFKQYTKDFDKTSKMSIQDVIPKLSRFMEK